MNFTLTSAANAGVLIECGGTRLLLDGIRRAPFAPFLPTPPQILEQMLSGPETSRWRSVDFLLFSHLHPDHFDEEAVRDYLAGNRVRDQARILFVGDGDYVPEWYLPAGHVDALFVNPLFLNSRAMPEMVRQHAPKTVYVYHLPAAENDDLQARFYRRVAARGAKKLPEGLVKPFESL